LRQASIFTAPKKINLLLLILLVAGCSLQKQSGFNRSMQNLTAHYNILFNANQILLQKQQDYAVAFVDNYNELLAVYQDTAVIKNKDDGLDKDLSAAVDKANKIINEKEQSHYQADAYLVMGKANYLGGNFFNAAEYFAYVVRSFPKQTKLVQEALEWDSRTQLYLNHPDTAKKLLDTAFQIINPKKRNPSDLYACKLQYDINVQDYKDGEEMAKQAIHYCRDSKLRLRWRFILGQLEELNGEQKEAYAIYDRIASSNANFEMAFNAQLNEIRIADMGNGVKTSRVDQLRALLKNPNNKEFTDQIYYQIGQQYYGDKDYDKAIANYKLSIRKSTSNQNQKGLSYLRIAEIEFSNKADYVRAKKYYDSTMMSLSPNYPGYLAIQKKASNLQLLTDRLQIISREDTLQMLAKMDEKSRNLLIDSMVTREILQQQAEQANIANSAKNTSNTASNTMFNTPGGSSFYFYNSNAVSQGYNDFKKTWGDRKLEDNWRRSNRPNTDQAANSVNPNVAATVGAMADPFAVSKNNVTAANYRQQIVQNLPLTPDKVAQSNLRIFNAYFDIANFYRDILDDKKEAINTYNTILKRFPENPNVPAIYYSLYRLYSELNDNKADTYKNILLNKYNATPFAQVIIDPDFSKHAGDKDAEFHTLYNSVYDLYAHRKYADVITQVDAIQKQYPNNKYSAQLYYLRAISAGHNEPLVPFYNDLEQIAKNYPGDKLIAPLVKKHIDYINANLVDMSKRHFILSDADTTQLPFTPPREDQKQTPFRRHHYYAPEPATQQVAKQEPKQVTTVKKDSVNNTPQKPVAVNKPAPAPSTGMFSMRDSTNYYFVINITNNTTNLSSSRFGIGQFNRAHYDNSNISHQLTYVGDRTELIYIGKFNNLAEVKTYARTIIPLMGDIMKIPKEKYSFFIITKQNLDKLADQKTLDSYLDYYQKNY
jgi:tetratricopeptide (TPR) repeat protein